MAEAAAGDRAGTARAEANDNGAKYSFSPKKNRAGAKKRRSCFVEGRLKAQNKKSKNLLAIGKIGATRQKRIKKRETRRIVGFPVARLPGLEPGASGLGGSRSIHLSYRRIRKLDAPAGARGE